MAIIIDRVVKIASNQGGFQGSLSGTDFGESLASLGDLDGDGVTDVAVGAEDINGGGNDRGGVYILFLNRNGTVKRQQLISNTAGGFNQALDNEDRFGVDVAGLGDVNGDGIPDLAVGVENDDDGATNAGAVWILFLNRNGTVQGRQKISATQGGFTGDLDAGDQFGHGLTQLGDFNGDGVPDLAIGARGDDDGGSNRGAVYVTFLNRNGTVQGFQKLSDTAGNFTANLDNDDQIGVKLDAFDINGDGRQELVIGAFLMTMAEPIEALTIRSFSIAMAQPIDSKRSAISKGALPGFWKMPIALAAIWPLLAMWTTMVARKLQSEPMRAAGPGRGLAAFSEQQRHS
ncbi:MAG: hypothetical protein HC890_03235 [Chloroflexaceae bacterium]|nr:hypothetical protein [Chloroflexaceae bacterium]